MHACSVLVHNYTHTHTATAVHTHKRVGRMNWDLATAPSESTPKARQRMCVYACVTTITHSAKSKTASKVSTPDSKNAHAEHEYEFGGPIGKKYPFHPHPPNSTASKKVNILALLH